MNNIIRLSEQLSEKHIVIHSASENAEAIIREMLYVLSSELKPEVCEDILDAIWVREKARTTGIGHGVAVPHARTALVKQHYCIAATSEKGIEFKTMDGKPAFLFFLIISPEYTVGSHLNIIAAISHLISKNVTISSDLNSALSSEEFIKILKEKEEKYII